MRAHQPVVEMQRTPSRLREQATVSLTPSPETRAYEQAVSARERDGKRFTSYPQSSRL